MYLQDDKSGYERLLAKALTAFDKINEFIRTKWTKSVRKNNFDLFQCIQKLMKNTYIFTIR